MEYVFVVFGGLVGYPSDDINKFLWMVGGLVMAASQHAVPARGLHGCCIPGACLSCLRAGGCAHVVVRSAFWGPHDNWKRDISHQWPNKTTNIWPPQVRIGGGVFPEIKEADYLAGGSDYRVDAAATKTMLNSLMYRLSYYE